MKNLLLIIGIVLFISSSCRTVEVTCPPYSNGTVVTYKHKKGTPKNSLKQKTKEEHLYFKRRNGKRVNNFVEQQAPKGKRFANDRKKSQKQQAKFGLVRGAPKQNRPFTIHEGRFLFEV